MKEGGGEKICCIVTACLGYLAYAALLPRLSTSTFGRDAPVAFMSPTRSTIWTAARYENVNSAWVPAKRTAVGKETYLRWLQMQEMSAGCRVITLTTTSPQRLLRVNTARERTREPL